MAQDIEFPGVGSFRDFCKEVAAGKRKTSHSLHTTCAREVLDIMEAATKMPAWFKKNYGITASFGGGSSDVVKKGFTFRAADNVFTVLPPTTLPQKKNVAITSIMAYKRLDDSEVALKIAKAAIALTIKHGEVSDSLVAKEAGEGSNRVSARRKDTFENPEGISVDGKVYRIKWTSTGKCLVTGFTVHKWAMLPAEPEQMQLFGG